LVNLNLDGIFVAIGHKPNSDFVKGVLTTDQAGYLMPRSKLLPSKIATDISDKTKELEKWQTWAKFGTMSEIDFAKVLTCNVGIFSKLQNRILKDLKQSLKVVFSLN
jgi:hypothetical protein